MKELHAILKEYRRLQDSKKKASLVTVVKVRGSTYRRPGARMLIVDDGTTIGTVSGGCLEADIAERVRKSGFAGEPVTLTYDMGADEEKLWGLNQGCNGVLHMLVEYLTPSRRFPSLDFVRENLAQEKSVAVATVFRVEGEFRAKVGTRLMLSEDGTVEEDVRNPVLSGILLDHCQSALRDGTSSQQRFQFTEGIVEVFVEVLRPPISLLLFGAGADAVPVAKLAAELGWRITVVDPRAALATAERFPAAHTIFHVHPDDLAERLQINPRSVAVVMTHNFSHDLALLKALLPLHLPYVGLLGPRKRTELLLQKLRESGFQPTDEQLSRFHAPVGLDIGGESPEEIALSILSEIQAVLSHRSGGSLRERRGPIH